MLRVVCSVPSHIHMLIDIPWSSSHFFKFSFKLPSPVHRRCSFLQMRHCWPVIGWPVVAPRRGWREPYFIIYLIYSFNKSFRFLSHYNRFWLFKKTVSWFKSEIIYLNFMHWVSLWFVSPLFLIWFRSDCRWRNISTMYTSLILKLYKFRFYVWKKHTFRNNFYCKFENYNFYK